MTPVPNGVLQQALYAVTEIRDLYVQRIDIEIESVRCVFRRSSEGGEWYLDETEDI